MGKVIPENELTVAKKILVVHPRLDVIGGAEVVLLKVLEVLIERKQDVFLLGELPMGSIFDSLPLSCIKQIPCDSEIASEMAFKPKRLQAYRTMFNRSKLKGRMCRKVAIKFDLEINTQDLKYFVEIGKKRVVYVHFPEIFARLQKPDLKHRWFWRLYYWPIAFQFKRSVKKNDLLMCNSLYTQRAITDYWGREAEVVYPPVDVKDFTSVEKETLVVSVGRFTPEKNFELVAEVARQLPDVKFVIAGRKGLVDSYFDKIVALKPANLDLLVDVTRKDLSVLLGRAKVYLHGMVGEHFGISVAEAMAAGCVPVVHSNGGPKEIVGGYGFLYNNVEECIRAIEAALQSEICPNDIVERAKMFNSDIFKRNFIEVLEKNGFL